MIKYKFTEQAKKLMQDNLYYAGEDIGYACKIPNLNFAPKRATKGSSGYDLSACIEKELLILPGEFIKLSTGVHIWIDEDVVDGDDINEDVVLAGLLMPRSSLRGLQLTNAVGLIDSDYQGEYFVSLYNYTNGPIIVCPGQKLVQLVIIFTYVGEIEYVENFEEITERGENGFGHTTRDQ